MSYDTKFRPQIGHWNDRLVIDQHGSLGTTFHVGGQNSELMDEAGLIAARQDINQLSLSTGHPRLQWWQHFTRLGGQETPSLASCTTWWAQSFDAAVLGNCTSDLFRNDLFFTLIVRPRPDVAAALSSAWHAVRGIATGTPRLSLPSASAAFVEDVETIAAKTEAAFRHLGIRQLGLREEDGVWFSEVWEAHQSAPSHRQRFLPRHPVVQRRRSGRAAGYTRPRDLSSPRLSNPVGRAAAARRDPDVGQLPGADAPVDAGAAENGKL